jgi:hypothetical protein
MMEYWNDGELEGHSPIIPLFQYSNIPVVRRKGRK